MTQYANADELLAMYTFDDELKDLNERGHVPLPVIRENIKDCIVPDVEQVRHGHWIQDRDTYYPDDYYCVYYDYRCSKCGHIYNNRGGLPKYCPNCGAKMDGEDE